MSAYLTMNDLADYLKVSKRKVQEMRSSCQLPKAIMVGRAPRWTQDDIDKFFEERRER